MKLLVASGLRCCTYFAGALIQAVVFRNKAAQRELGGSYGRPGTMFLVPARNDATKLLAWRLRVFVGVLYSGILVEPIAVSRLRLQSSFSQ